MASVSKGKNFVRDRTFESVRLGMHRTTLFFDEREQELQFRQHFFNKNRKIVEYCVTGLVILTTCLFATDYYYFGYDDNVYLYRAIVRGTIQLPVSIAWLAWILVSRKKNRALNFSSINQKQINAWNRRRKGIDDYTISVISSLFIGFAILGQTYISREPDHGVYMLYFFVVYLFVAIPYFFALLITWSLYLSFVISMYLVLSNNNITEGVSFNVGHWGSTSFGLSVVYLTMTNLLLSIAAYSLERSERIEFMHSLDLEQQSAIIQKILHNLLPTHVTEQLRNHKIQQSEIIADPSTECSILFSDLVAFTRWSSTISADRIIFRLHELYSLFDQLCNKHRVYKVETIGDAYFVSANCPIRRPNHAESLLLLGREMMTECKLLDWAGYTPRMRIGIHSGFCMAGVVGTKMPRYHLFGETVMIAETLETTGKPDCLHISQATYDLVEYNNQTIDNYMKQNYHIIKRRQEIEVLERHLQTYLIILDELVDTNTLDEINNEQTDQNERIGEQWDEEEENDENNNNNNNIKNLEEEEEIENNNGNDADNEDNDNDDNDEEEEDIDDIDSPNTPILPSPNSPDIGEAGAFIGFRNDDDNNDEDENDIMNESNNQSNAIESDNTAKLD